MERNYKSLLSIALVLLLVAITTLTFAFWDQLTGSENGTINIGEGKTITITMVVGEGEGKTLIPNGALKGANDTYFIEHEFQVNIVQSLASGALTDYALEVTLTEINLIDQESNSTPDDTGLINFEFTDLTDQVLNATNVGNPLLYENIQKENTIKVKITLTNPGNEEDYNKIKGKTITYTLAFEFKKQN